MILVDPLPLKLVHLELIDSDASPNKIPLDLFPLEESLKEFIGAYEELPSYHHKDWFPYCLSTQEYFRKSIAQGAPLSRNEEQISTSRPRDCSVLLSGETTNAIISDQTPDKAIKDGKCLSLKEFLEYYDNLHQFPDSFAWSYEEMPNIDDSIVVHNIVLSFDAKSVKQKIQKMNPKVALLVKTETRSKMSHDSFGGWVLAVAGTGRSWPWWGGCLTEVDCYSTTMVLCDRMPLTSHHISTMVSHYVINSSRTAISHWHDASKSIIN